MHDNLERRFLNLEASRNRLQMALRLFSLRFRLLFAALADDMGITWDDLGERMGWGPVPGGGNKIMRGEAEPSVEDCYRLLEIYLGSEASK